MPPSAMAAIWPNEPATRKTIAPAMTAMVARRRSGVSARAMPHNAWATTATATILRPVDGGRAGCAGQACRKAGGDKQQDCGRKCEPYPGG